MNEGNYCILKILSACKRYCETWNNLYITFPTIYELTVGNDCTEFQPVLLLGPQVMVQCSEPLPGHYPCLSESPRADLFLGSNSALLPIRIKVTVTINIKNEQNASEFIL